MLSDVLVDAEARLIRWAQAHDLHRLVHTRDAIILALDAKQILDNLLFLLTQFSVARRSGLRVKGCLRRGRQNSEADRKRKAGDRAASADAENRIDHLSPLSLVLFDSVRRDSISRSS